MKGESRRETSTGLRMGGITGFRQVVQRSIQIGPKVLDRLDPYFSGEDSLASNKAGAFLP